MKNNKIISVETLVESEEEPSANHDEKSIAQLEKELFADKKEQDAFVEAEKDKFLQIIAKSIR